MAPRDAAAGTAPDRRPDRRHDRVHDMIILGAGFSGLIMAMEARRRGLTDIVILEKATEIGGTWRENTYPGVACDIPSHLYSIATHPNPDWTGAYAGGAEILDYLRRVAREEGLYAFCRFGQEMTAARWQGDGWQVHTRDGGTWRARVLVSAIGALHVPAIPDIPGADSFPGPAFHSARWDHAADLAGKRIAVVGTGASAVQFVPEIAPEAARVSIFQRTPPYVLPRPDGPIPPWVRRLHRAWPLTRRLRRWAIFRLFELRHATFTGHPRAVRIAMNWWRKALERAIHDPETRTILTPPYRIGCKRILSSNRWYPTLARDNVEVIPSGLARIEGKRLIARDGTAVEADLLIWATGFRVTDALERLSIAGEGGRTLAQAWADGIGAHLGTAVAGFPNLFFLLGPHTGLGHNSVVLMIEAQVAHIGRVLAAARREGLAAICPRETAQRAFIAEIDRRLSATVWQNGGCRSWYQDENGRNPTLWPGTVAEFQRRMARAGLEHYRPAAPETAADTTLGATQPG